MKKDLLKFLCFILYTTGIFFLPNTYFIAVFGSFPIILLILQKVTIKELFTKFFNFFPFLFITFCFNCFLDNIKNAIFLEIKLLLVLLATFSYAKSTSLSQMATTIGLIAKPLKIFKIDVKEIEIMLYLTFSMLFVLKAVLREITYACKAKNIPMNLSYFPTIFSAFFISLMRRMNQIEDALIEKGFY